MHSCAHDLDVAGRPGHSLAVASAAAPSTQALSPVTLDRPAPRPICWLCCWPRRMVRVI